MSSRFCGAFAEQRFILAFRPAYSPDLNPIEESFSVLKAWIKWKNELVQSFGGDFAQFLDCAVRECDFKRLAPGHFRHAQVHVDEEEE